MRAGPRVIAERGRGRPRRRATATQEVRALAAAVEVAVPVRALRRLLASRPRSDRWDAVEAELEAEGLLTMPRAPRIPDEDFDPIVLPGEPVSETLRRERR